ncbi:MAG: DUF2530 domain-containing protein [Actinobacteria bacterium]|nr:DUF2530 domain-containing protein [Actinomycetota bacterium]
MLHNMRSAMPIIIIGIVCWTLALIVAIIIDAVAKIILTCLMGIFLGFLGLRYTRRRIKREGK